MIPKISISINDLKQITLGFDEGIIPTELCFWAKEKILSVFYGTALQERTVCSIRDYINRELRVLVEQDYMFQELGSNNWVINKPLFKWRMK